MGKKEKEDHLDLMIGNILQDALAINITYSGDDSLNKALDDVVKKLLEKKRQLAATRRAHQEKTYE